MTTSYSSVPAPEKELAEPGTTVPAFAIPPNLWGHKKTKLKNMFSKLTEDDLQYVVGEEQQLLGRLCARLHKSDEEMQELITRL
jgi:hypothetical protein